ncbi:hypothetical protein ACIOEZ_07375 [Streptomyces sp. NPDC087866]|uniref:hypothetical protein n=1 Tax=unclassified Streptomyces TaxID=2593676 RepID=UPI0022587CD8|nr:hypothetical protein [Streptomyces sp. NBC_01789]MCX4444924.1 hypothetical protein [Streptomyces sp. NBC_01789]
MDLLAALNASVTTARECRDEDSGDATVHQMRPCKKASTKKATIARKRSVF